MLRQIKHVSSFQPCPLPQGCSGPHRPSPTCILCSAYTHPSGLCPHQTWVPSAPSGPRFISHHSTTAISSVPATPSFLIQFFPLQIFCKQKATPGVEFTSCIWSILPRQMTTNGSKTCFCFVLLFKFDSGVEIGEHNVPVRVWELTDSICHFPFQKGF